MNAVDRELDERMRGAADSHDSVSTDSSIENAPRGAQVIQVNTLSTPVLLAIFGCFAVLAVSVAIVAMYAGLAVGAANEASSFGHQAEREARLAQERLDNLNVRVQVAEALVQAYGLQKEKQ